MKCHARSYIIDSIPNCVGDSDTTNISSFELLIAAFGVF